MKIAIVTSADAKYFGLLKGLLTSLNDFPQFGSLERCVLDVGLTEEQKSRLPALGVKTVVTAEWDLDFPLRATTPAHFRAMTARPHLPKYFPGYDMLIWLDSDTFLASPTPIDLFIRASANGALAIVPEVDRAYDHCFNRKHESTTFHRHLYAAGWGAGVASLLAEYPMLNAGAFALRTDSPCWNLWSQTLREGLQNTNNNIIEQAALNLVVYSKRHPAHFLPAWCNWLGGNAQPLLDMATRNLHSPLLPHEQIGLLHAGIAKSALMPIPCSDGLYRHLPLTYHALRKADLPAGTPTPPPVTPIPPSGRPPSPKRDMPGRGHY